MKHRRLHHCGIFVNHCSSTNAKSDRNHWVLDLASHAVQGGTRHLRGREIVLQVDWCWSAVVSSSDPQIVRRGSNCFFRWTSTPG